KKSTTFPCLKLSQPVGDFFIGVISHKVLTEISYFDVRRVLQEERDVERYLGIQRPLNDARVRDLKKYVTFYDSTFPTSIIIAVNADTASYSEDRREMTLSNIIQPTLDDSILFRHIARVIDGQHRIAGLAEYDGPEFDLSVTIFVGIDIAQQAQIFSTVNLEQTKVNKSLAYDLFELSASRSPQKTCHNVVVALDQDTKSPFYHRIKRLGTATSGRIGETLTQATFVESLLKLISNDPRQDRDHILRHQAIPLASNLELNNLPFRNLFLQGGDINIAKIIWNYFEAVKNQWPEAWDSNDRGYILNRTNGFRALMRMFRPIYLMLGRPGEIIDHARYEELFSKMEIKDSDFHINNFPPGSSGEAALVQRISSELTAFG
ncbi:DGQHR domain-containing protein, partial [Acidisoma silvae]